ncbi:F-box only protein 21 [Xylocopa sonorina]|uniref:F-box only protein 21 n=1 Tax=Xylocopa sonorina TaxID=1818115 RepID=UPI00403AEA94
MASDTIISLPSEVIVHILEDKRLELSDVINFGSTCKTLRAVVNENNKLWKTKFFQRWPFLEEVYQTSKELEGKIINWREEVKASVNSRKKLLYLLSLMSSKHYKKQGLCNSEFKEYDPLFCPEEGAHPLAYYFLVDELVSLIKCPARSGNLTLRYYALTVVRYLRQKHLKTEWEKFISLPPKQQTLERGATIVAQWSQAEKHISYLAISSKLDNIAEQTKELLREHHPAHPIFSVPKETFTFWKNNIIDDNQWSVSDSKQITNALCTVLFKKLAFHGNEKMYYSLENLFIDRVLEDRHGIPITLAIVFESVARRLGIRCEPVSFPSHFLLRWRERYNSESKNAENFYIDVFNGGQFLTKKNCPRIGGISKCPIEKYNIRDAASAIEVVTRMVDNLKLAATQHINDRITRLRSTLELQHMIQPNDTKTILELAEIYTVQHIDLTELVKTVDNMLKDPELISRQEAITISKSLQEYQQNLQPEIEVYMHNIMPKKRTPQVKYAIGLIMMHRVDEYLCVITGWDACCMAAKEWMNEVYGEDPDGDLEQPFYHILDRGSHCYVAQENLVLASNPQWIDHHAIGRYFCKFSGTHYIPNEENAREYPDDEQVRNELVAKFVEK